jgi:signal transduction histidine kinase
MTIKDSSAHADIFHLIVEDAGMGFYIFRLETGGCLYANQMAKELVECTEGQALRLEDLTPQRPGREGVRPFESSLFEQEGLHQDVMVQKLNGMIFIANVSIKRIQIDGIPHLLLMVQDVTLQKKLQREVMAKQSEIHTAYTELLAQNHQLKELDVAKNKFLAVTTHELRTPLSAILATTEVLKLKLYDSAEQLDEFVGMIWDSANHLSALINDILDFAKIQAGKMDFYVQERDMLPYLRGLVEKFQGMAGASEVRLTLRPPADSSVLCYADDLRLKQVLDNIVSNAIKYNRKNGTVEIYLEYDADELKVFVKDTGVGIPADSVNKVFNEFETLGKVGNHQKGTGLGMPIAKRLIEGMGGAIHLASEVGVGTTFWICIPRQKTLEDRYYRARPDSAGDLAA